RERERDIERERGIERETHRLITCSETEHSGLLAQTVGLSPRLCFSNAIKPVDSKKIDILIWDSIICVCVCVCVSVCGVCVSVCVCVSVYVCVTIRGDSIIQASIMVKIH